MSAEERLREILREVVAEWDERHASEDHRTGITPEPAGITAARAETETPMASAPGDQTEFETPMASGIPETELFDDGNSCCGGGCR